MQIPERESQASRGTTLGKAFLTAIVAATLCLVEGCGGGKSPLPLLSENGSLVAIHITPASTLIQLSEVRQMFATGIYSNGNTQDLTAQVSWSASSAPSSTSYVEVSSSGVATAKAIGLTTISATLGPVMGLIQLTVNTNGFSSGTVATVNAPYKNTVIDVGYLPVSKSPIQGAYAVQVVNLDADQFSSVLPPPAALLASVPMPPGYVPNATVASLASPRVAVISYSSPDVQIIDASNQPSDISSNTVIATYAAPVTKKVSFNGIECMICAAVVNPVNNQLVLSTAQGYYSMDLTTGTFTPLPFTPTAFPAPSFAIDPIAQQPYILSPTFGQNPQVPGEVQFLNLATNATTSSTNSGLSQPLRAAMDLNTNYTAIVGANSSSQSLVTLTDPADPLFSLAPNLGVCEGQPAYMNMAALAVGAGANVSVAPHTLFTSQTSGNCVGFQVWPPATSGQVTSSNICYGYGPMPNTPDGAPFVSGSDPNAIATFTSTIDKNAYGLLVDGSQNWMAKLNLANILSNADIIPGFTPPLPFARKISASVLAADSTLDTVRFLPTPPTTVTLSSVNVDFGSLNVGVLSSALAITLSYIGASTLNISSISIEGANAGDFSETNNCLNGFSAPGTCTIQVTFTPKATGARSATLAVSDDGGASPQTVSLSGTGT